jgi:hypothetical protein
MKRGASLTGSLDREQVLVRSEYTPRPLAFNITLVAKARERELRLRVRQFRAWEAKRADGSLLAVPVRKPFTLEHRYWDNKSEFLASPAFEVPGAAWLDHDADAFDVAMLLLLRSMGLAYAFRRWKEPGYG